MEKAENGELVLALSVDLNENEEANNKHHRLEATDCNVTEVKSRLLNDGSKKAYPTDKVALSGTGYVYVSSHSKNVNSDGALPSLQVTSPVDHSIMLDFIPECLPEAIHDSCVILEQHTDGILNGFPESSVETTVVVSEAGGGSCEGTPYFQTAAVSADRPQEGNGMLFPTRISDTVMPEECAGETEDSNADKLDKGHLNSEARPKSTAVYPALSCAGKHQQKCTCMSAVADMKLSNGDVDFGSSVSLDVDMTCIDHSQEMHSSEVQNNELDAPDGETKVSNGELLIVNNSSLNTKVSYLTLGTIGGLSDGAILTQQLESIRSSPGSYDCSSRESGHVSGKASPAALLSEPVCCSLESEEGLVELSSKLSITPSPEHSSEFTETESSFREDSSEACAVSRPQSLRTTPSYAVSLSCDATPISPDDGEGYIGADGGMDPDGVYRNRFEINRRQSAPEKLPDTVDTDMNIDQRGPGKKHVIAEFFTRGLFSRKPKEQKPGTPSTPGWKLFGKIPPRDNLSKDSFTIQQDDSPASVNSVSAPNLSVVGEQDAKAGQTAGPHPQNQPMRRKNLEFEPTSTTALILEDRPANLPAKSMEEAQRHRHEYEEMVAGAKRRELKEAQRKKRQMKERFKQEESIANAMVIWNSEVLPNWESMRNTRRVRELWWQGLPPSVRGKVWSLAIGNELNITPELYEIFLSRAKEKWRSFSETSSETDVEADCGASLADRESSLDLIKLDISRTFPSLYIFQKGGPYHDLLHSVLGAYTCYRPDVGYVQGMSFIAAVLILNMEEADAFIAFANLLNKPCQMAFFRVDHDLMLKYFAAFEVFFEENLPRLFKHFQSNSLTPDFYLIDWIFTLYSKSLPLDVACRVWDVFCRDGEEALFRTGLGILRLYQDVLLQMDFIHSAQFLSRLPDNTPAHTLFNCIANTHMLSSNRRWNQVFAALMKDGSTVADRNNSPALRS